MQLNANRQGHWSYLFARFIGGLCCSHGTAALALAQPRCNSNAFGNPHAAAHRQPDPYADPQCDGHTNLHASPTPCAANGTLQRVEIAVAALRRPMPVQVYLPPCYPQQAQYPVLFLLHGQNADEGQWPRLGIAEAADRLIRSQAIRPLIIVMPREEYWWINPFDGPFEASFFEGLMPWVEASYPICAGAGCRALGGLSRGAAWAVNLGFSHPGVFGSIGAHSLPPFSGDAERLPYWLRAFGEQPLPKLYLDVGEKDRYHKATEQFEKTLTDLQVPHEWVLQPGAHDEAYWAAHVEDYLRWYDQAWALPARAD